VAGTAPAPKQLFGLLLDEQCMFPHQNLDVYCFAVSLVGEVLLVLKAPPKSSHDEVAQLRRAAIRS
jgi:hypothetical protein